MATFVKLTNGDVVNKQNIKSIKCHEYASAGDWAQAIYRDADEEGSRLKTTPSIQLQLGSDQNPLLLKYESEQERDTEFERIESILLHPPALITFGNLAFDPTLIQLIRVDWKGYDDTGLGVSIKMPGLRSFEISVERANQVEWEKCMNLLAQFDISLPPVPTFDW